MKCSKRKTLQFGKLFLERKQKIIISFCVNMIIEIKLTIGIMYLYGWKIDDTLIINVDKQARGSSNRYRQSLKSETLIFNLIKVEDIQRLGSK